MVLNSVNTIPSIRQEIIDRFWSYVDIQDNSQCWHWRKRVNVHGYGTFKVGTKNMIASRLALFLSTGVQPENHYACHSCDNPRCCNPSHLRWATHKQNMIDLQNRNAKWRKHIVRQSKFVLNPSKRSLHDYQVRDIRNLLIMGYKPNEIAKQYGVSRTIIHQIKWGNTYKHISSTIEPIYRSTDCFACVPWVLALEYRD